MCALINDINNFILNDSNIYNNHILIKGASGMGKTFLIQKLLVDLLIREKSAAFVFDFSNSYDKQHLDINTRKELQNNLIYITPYTEGISLNPFAARKVNVGGELIDEKPAITSKMITDMLSSCLKFTPKQTADCYYVIVNILKSNETNCTFKEILLKLKQLESDSAQSAALKLQFLSDLNVFSEIPNQVFEWDKLIYKPQIVIFNFAGYPKAAQVLLTEFLLQDLLQFTIYRNNDINNFHIILDEFQNIDTKSDNSALSSILREGRKFGIGAILSTQHLKSFSTETIADLNQAATKIDFNPASDSESKKLASKIDPDKKEEWYKRIKTLKRGEMLLQHLGQKAKIIKL